MITEVWKSIKDYEGLYEVSNLGRVKSLAYIIYTYKKTRTIKLKEKIKKSSKNNRGYLVISFCKNYKVKTFLVHRLVAQAFIKNPLNKPQINHKKGIKTDNRPSQLEWCTNLENMRHAYSTGVRNNNYLIKKVLQIKNKKIIKIWDSQFEASKYFKITKCNISACCCGTQKTSAGFQWRYQ